MCYPPSSSVAELIQRYTDVLSPVTTSLNLTLNSFGTVIPPSTTPIGEVKLTDAYGTALNPAPVTSTDLSSGPWRLLSGTILSTLATSLRTENGTEYAKENKAVMAPGLNLGKFSQCSARMKTETDVWDTYRQHWYVIWRPCYDMIVVS